MARTTALLVLLALAGCGGSGPASARYGLSATPPPGWHVRVFRGGLEASTAPFPPRRNPVSGFARPLSRNLDVVLFEDTADSQWSPPLETWFYTDGAPRPFALGDFGPPELGGDNPGNHGFARRNFTVGGRYFDLFVECGGPAPSRRRLDELDALVRSLRIEPGDFYPGGARPARFRPARGWQVRSVGTIPVGTSDLSVTVAATVRWVDSLNAPAEHTLPRLRATRGTAIRVNLVADSRSAPSAQGTRLRLGAIGEYRWGEGSAAPGVSAQSGTWAVAGEYQVTVEIIYGEPRPSAAEQRRAHAELARLILPRWPRWR